MKIRKPKTHALPKAIAELNENIQALKSSLTYLVEHLSEEEAANIVMDPYIDETLAEKIMRRCFRVCATVYEIPMPAAYIPGYETLIPFDPKPDLRIRVEAKEGGHFVHFHVYAVRYVKGVTETMRLLYTTIRRSSTADNLALTIWRDILHNGVAIYWDKVVEHPGPMYDARKASDMEEVMEADDMEDW